MTSHEPCDADARAAAEAARKTCPACGRSFGCGLGACWCAQVTLDAAARAELRARYADCLCPDCLAAHASARPAPWDAARDDAE